MGGMTRAISGLGIRQSWVGVVRTAGVTYFNTSVNPIAISISVQGNTGVASSVSVAINGVGVIIGSGNAPAGVSSVYAGILIVPPSGSYVFTDTAVTSRTTMELL